MVPTKTLGLGFCASLAQIFFCVFFSGFHLPDKRNVQTVFLRRLLARRFLRPFLLRRFLRPFLLRFWCADFCAHFRADFPQIFLRSFGACKIGVPESRKNAQKMRRKIRGVRMALLRGAPHSLSAFSSRQHVTQPPLGRNTQGEHVSVHCDIFGLKCMLAFAPRFFKNKNREK